VGAPCGQFEALSGRRHAHRALERRPEQGAEALGRGVGAHAADVHAGDVHSVGNQVIAGRVVAVRRHGEHDQQRRRDSRDQWHPLAKHS
jgi:hypothetical protein